MIIEGEFKVKNGKKERQPIIKSWRSLFFFVLIVGIVAVAKYRSIVGS